MSRLKSVQAIALWLAATVLLASIPALGPTAPASAAGYYFTDLTNHWAEHSIRKLALKGIVAGYGDGSFQPERHVTRLEALVTLVRVLGLEDAARANPPVPRELDNPEQVPPWGLPYVSVAYSKGLLVGGELMALRPQDDVKRWELAVFAVRALGQASAADARSEANLTYPDLADVPYWARGYVAVATDKEIIKGDTLGYLRPLGIVTRAQLATILDRLDRLTQTPADGRETRGALVEVDASFPGKVTVDTDDGKRLTLSAGGDIEVYRLGQPAVLANLQPWDEITAVADEAGFVRWLVADAPALRLHQGKVLRLPTDQDRSIAILEGDTSRSFPLADSVTIRKDGVAAAWKDVLVTDDVTVGVLAGKVTTLEAKTTTRRLAGVLSTITLSNTNPAVGVTPQGGPEVVLSLTGTTEIFRDSTRIDVSGLALGYYVEVTVVGNRAARIDVQPKEVLQELAGVIVALDPANHQFTLAVTGQPLAAAADPRRLVRTADNTVVVKHGTVKDFAYLAVGDRVIMAGYDQVNTFLAAAVIVTYTTR